MIKPTYRTLLGALIALTAIACESNVDCEPGQASCPCAAASRCDDGLVCSDGVCTAPRETTLVVPSDARACEVLLHDDRGQVTGARFDTGVTGTHVREAPRTALSFASSPEAPIGSVRVQVLGDSAAFSIESSRCFDGSGRPLSDGVRIGS